MQQGERCVRRPGSVDIAMASRLTPHLVLSLHAAAYGTNKTVRRDEEMRNSDMIQGGPSASGKIDVDIKFKVPSLA